MLPWEMVDKSLSPLQTSFRLFFVSGQSEQATSSWSGAPSDFFCWHLHPSARDMTPQLHLIFLALKRKAAARGKRAPRAPSIVDVFCRLPSQGFVADSVARAVCPLVREAA
jgi:hypothetical protein